MRSWDLLLETRLRQRISLLLALFWPILTSSLQTHFQCTPSSNITFANVTPCIDVHTDDNTVLLLNCQPRYEQQSFPQEHTQSTADVPVAVSEMSMHPQPASLLRRRLELDYRQLPWDRSLRPSYKFQQHATQSASSSVSAAYTHPRTNLP